jgi:hypothetical protein
VYANAAAPVPNPRDDENEAQDERSGAKQAALYCEGPSRPQPCFRIRFLDDEESSQPRYVTTATQPECLGEVPGKVEARGRASSPVSTYAAPNRVPKSTVLSTLNVVASALEEWVGWCGVSAGLTRWGRRRSFGGRGSHRGLGRVCGGGCTGRCWTAWASTGAIGWSAAGVQAASVRVKEELADAPSPVIMVDHERGGC